MSLYHGSDRDASSNPNYPSADNPRNNNCLRRLVYSFLLFGLFLVPACGPGNGEDKGTGNDGDAAGTAAQKELLQAVRQLRQQLAENAAGPGWGDTNTAPEDEVAAANRARLQKTELDHALLPFREAFEGLLEKIQADRRSYRELAFEVRRLGVLLEEGLTTARKTGNENQAEQKAREEKTRMASEELQKLRTRLDQMEGQLAEREKKHAEEKQLLIRALEVSSKRLEALLEKLSAPGSAEAGRQPKAPENKKGADKGKEKPAEKDPTDPGSAGETPSKPGTTKGKPVLREPVLSEGKKKAGLSRLEFWLLLSLPVLVLLVLLLLFVPRRLRPPVQQVEFESGVGEVEEALALHGRGQPTGQGKIAREIQKALVERVQLQTQSPSPAQGDGTDRGRRPAASIAAEPGPRAHKSAPRLHSVELVFPSKRAAAQAAKPDVLEQRLQIFLEAEPRVLRRPAPRLCSDGEKQSLQFYTQPTLPAEEGRRLEAALRRHLCQPRHEEDRGRGTPAA